MYPGIGGPVYPGTGGPLPGPFGAGDGLPYYRWPGAVQQPGTGGPLPVPFGPGTTDGMSYYQWPGAVSQPGTGGPLPVPTGPGGPVPMPFGPVPVQGQGPAGFGQPQGFMYSPFSAGMPSAPFQQPGWPQYPYGTAVQSSWPPFHQYLPGQQGIPATATVVSSALTTTTATVSVTAPVSSTLGLTTLATQRSPVAAPVSSAPGRTMRAPQHSFRRDPSPTHSDHDDAFSVTAPSGDPLLVEARAPITFPPSSIFPNLPFPRVWISTGSHTTSPRRLSLLLLLL